MTKETELKDEIEKEANFEEDFMILNKNDICVRCKKNKATLIYTNSQMDFIHGFTEKICQECHDKQMKESNWYKKGYQKAKQKFIEMIENIKNPYPENIFPKLELSEFQTQTINDFLTSNLRFSFDRLSAELMRRARNNLKHELKSSIIGEQK